MCFFGKKHATFKWKNAILGLPVSPGSAEAQVRWGGKIKYILIAYLLGETCAKNYRNCAMYVKIIASQKVGRFFETRCTYSHWNLCPSEEKANSHELHSLSHKAHYLKWCQLTTKVEHKQAYKAYSVKCVKAVYGISRMSTNSSCPVWQFGKTLSLCEWKNFCM